MAKDSINTGHLNEQLYQNRQIEDVMTGADSIEDKLQLLKQRYKTSFPEKLAAFESARETLESGDREEGLGQLRHHAHKLAGSGASYGFNELSSLARELEREAIALQGSSVENMDSLVNKYNALKALLKG